MQLFVFVVVNGGVRRFLKQRNDYVKEVAHKHIKGRLMPLYK